MNCLKAFELTPIKKQTSDILINISTCFQNNVLALLLNRQNGNWVKPFIYNMLHRLSINFSIFSADTITRLKDISLVPFMSLHVFLYISSDCLFVFSCPRIYLGIA